MSDIIAQNAFKQDNDRTDENIADGTKTAAAAFVVVRAKMANAAKAAKAAADATAKQAALEASQQTAGRTVLTLEGIDTARKSADDVAKLLGARAEQRKLMREAAEAIDAAEVQVKSSTALKEQADKAVKESDRLITEADTASRNFDAVRLRNAKKSQEAAAKVADDALIESQQKLSTAKANQAKQANVDISTDASLSAPVILAAPVVDSPTLKNKYVAEQNAPCTGMHRVCVPHLIFMLFFWCCCDGPLQMDH